MAKVPVHNGSLGGEQYVSGLEGLHQAFSVALGQPVYAPIDVSSKQLKILDSGCNTGKSAFHLSLSQSLERKYEFIFRVQENGYLTWRAFLPQ